MTTKVIRIYNVVCHRYPRYIVHSCTYVCVHCLLECQDALGMESRGITDGQISASSQYDARHAPTKARLNYKPSVREPGAWSAGRRDKNPWLQIDLRNRISKVTRVATQGRPDIPQWVTKYKLQYSDNGKDFLNYKMKGETEDEVR